MKVYIIVSLVIISLVTSYLYYTTKTTLTKTQSDKSDMDSKIESLKTTINNLAKDINNRDATITDLKNAIIASKSVSNSSQTIPPVPASPNFTQPDLRTCLSTILLLYNISPPSSSSIMISSPLPTLSPSDLTFEQKQMNAAAYLSVSVLESFKWCNAAINSKYPINYRVKYMLKKTLLKLLQQSDKNNYDIAAVLMVIASCSALPFSYSITNIDINLKQPLLVKSVNSTISVTAENNRIDTIGIIMPKPSEQLYEDTDYSTIRPLLTSLIKLFLPRVVLPFGASPFPNGDKNQTQTEQNTLYNLNAFSIMLIVKLGTALLDNVIPPFECE